MKVVNYNKENKGITLIALIITIVVLLILAGVTLSFVMQGGILDKSQLAVNEYQKAANDENNTLKYIDEQLNNKIAELQDGNVDMNKVKEDFEKNPENYIHPDQEDTNGDRAVGTDGKPVNMDLWDGWQKDEDGAHLNSPKSGSDAYALYSNSDIGEDGRIQGTVPQYIYSEADGKVYPVVSMDLTFLSCSNLKIPPKIPSTVTSMHSTFENCTQLPEAPVIPDGVTDMTATFENCKALQVAPTIPNGVIDMGWTFYGCELLKEVQDKIPDTVLNMSNTFMYCSQLKKAPNLSLNVTSLSATFDGCSLLETAPEIIPESVTRMPWAFMGCELLQTAPTIPGKVVDARSAFSGCSSLTGDLIINIENIESDKYEDFLRNAATNPGCELKLSGSCPQLKEILGTATSGNVSLK